MALLTLKDIGKIYVSEGNVAVGIRGVNLSFDRGEFVAVTGKSGSGKSTLLNVISGMDSYEEGELYIDGEMTSHYLQPEWEEYREKYISFIFQDYNIIDSFTVLENVELALMHIEDKKLRRQRALELIDRVGLSSHVRHKGSRLSGGQKQRTVIARALAKDSPIILADEPTGNLDSATSKEIIELLAEVSRDKLLIVVTHNFDEVEGYATRHVRVFDGAVESDQVLRECCEPVTEDDTPERVGKKKKNERVRQLKNGFVLGKTIFTAKPKLSIFLCFLMLIGTMGVFLMTSLCGSAANAFKPNYMFNRIEGRLIITKQSGEVITDEELKEIASEYGAVDYLHYDKLLDEGRYNQILIPSANDGSDEQYLTAHSVFGRDYGDDIIGRYPQMKDEVFLYLPIYYRPFIGDDRLLVDEIVFGSTAYKLVGVKYYYDNNIYPECLFSEEGFRVATASHFLSDYADVKIAVSVVSWDFESSIALHSIATSFDIPSDKVYISSDAYSALVAQGSGSYSTTASYTARYYRFNYYNGMSKQYVFQKTFENADISDVRPTFSTGIYYSGEDILVISDELLVEIADEVLSQSYVQASLFFESDEKAHNVADMLKEKGYIAVPSDTTYDPDSDTVILGLFEAIALIFVWVISILFLAFFINLCSSRTLGAFKGDMAIMRSMGISVKVIRIGMYVRMLISLIPAFLTVALVAVMIFTSPTFNEYFVYLYPWQYGAIFVGMIALTARTTHKQIKRLFGESVKKSLRGGSAE